MMRILVGRFFLQSDCANWVNAAATLDWFVVESWKIVANSGTDVSSAIAALAFSPVKAKRHKISFFIIFILAIIFLYALDKI